MGQFTVKAQKMETSDTKTDDRPTQNLVSTSKLRAVERLVECDQYFV
jgi:hypothetical protein